MTDNRETNQVTVAGTVAGKPIPSHTVYAEQFYTFPLRIARLSDAYDTVNILISERLFSEAVPLDIDSQIKVSGQFRSYNNYTGSGSGADGVVLSDQGTNGCLVILHKAGVRGLGGLYGSNRNGFLFHKVLVVLISLVVYAVYPVIGAGQGGSSDPCAGLAGAGLILTENRIPYKTGLQAVTAPAIQIIVIVSIVSGNRVYGLAEIFCCIHSTGSRNGNGSANQHNTGQNCREHLLEFHKYLL